MTYADNSEADGNLKIALLEHRFRSLFPCISQLIFLCIKILTPRYQYSALMQCIQNC